MKTNATPLDMMLDVETLGRKPGCQVMSIGAVMFDPLGITRAHEEPANQFYVVINSFDAMNRGFKTDPETLRWWTSLDIWTKMLNEMNTSNTGVREACRQFSDFVNLKRPQQVWANSPNFDIDIMAAMHQRVDEPFPITYRQHADYRTLMNECYPDRTERPVRPENFPYKPHHALGDALLQVEQVITAHRLLPARVLDRLLQQVEARGQDPSAMADTLAALREVTRKYPVLRTLLVDDDANEVERTTMPTSARVDFRM